MRNIKRKTAKHYENQAFGEFCLWDTALINNFSQHLTVRGYYVVAVEKDAAESVFHFLLEKLKNVYYNPTDDVISVSERHKVCGGEEHGHGGADRNG